MAYRLGIDIGGTFTDLVLLDEATGALQFGKTLTTHGDPTAAIVHGTSDLLERAGVRPEQVETLVHGTTLVTNAVIERKGAPTALLTTAGFRDVLEIGREMRYDIYDLSLEMPEPLVPRNRRFDVPERVAADGRVVQALDVARLGAAVDEAVASGAASVAVCYLHAFTNPAHERETAALIRERHPGLFVTLSSDVMPEIREFERTSATVMNAYVQPITDEYLRRLEARLRGIGFGGVIHIMLSSGRLTTVDGARAAPIHLLESGPAGGTRFGVFFGGQTGAEDLLCFDMGGTTAKASLIHGGEPEITTHFEAARVRRFRKGSGLPVRVPVIDMIEIGAGGGSIARVDALGLVRVGPESAGSEPGPACYGRGGTLPTVTDCDLVLGYLDEGFFLGGEMRLERGAAEAAIREHLADPLGIAVEEAALGVHRIVNENMANAARVHILEKGHDPRRYSMLAFGGAGPVHAFGVARLLGAPRVTIPVGAGVTSALGFLITPVATEQARSHLARLDSMDWAHVGALLAEMEAAGRAFLRDAGVADERMEMVRSAEMRYRGQGHEITVPLPSGVLGPVSVPAMVEAFEEVYRARYGRLAGEMPIESVTWRVLLRGPAPDVRPHLPAAGGEIAALKGYRSVRFVDLPDRIDCPVYDRYQLRSGERFGGPAIVEERESTFVVGPRSELSVDEHLNVVVHLRGRDDA